MSQEKPERSNKKLLRSILILIAGICLIAYGANGLYRRYSATHSPDAAPPNSSETIVLDDEKPEETPVDPAAPYEVPPDQPRSIKLPSIGAEGFIQRVGTTDKNQVGVPSNINFAGWYVDMPKPGDKGVSLIDGHVSGVYRPGIFKNLSQLKPGERFAVEFGDRSLKEFEVVSVDSYSLDEIDQKLFASHKEIDNQLNLITCGGQFDSEKQQYLERVLVVSKAL